MNLDLLLKDRADAKTLAGLARRMFRSGRKYSDLERNLRQRYVLEALIANGGDQQAAAKTLGIHYNTVNRVVRSLGLNSDSVIELSKAMRGEQ